MTRLIKKYKNRRLYDTDISQYITIEDLQRYVIDGVQFEVQDAASKEDISAAILLQIFVEMEVGPTTFLSPEVLRQLIVLANHPLRQSAKALFSQLITAIETQIQSNMYPVVSEAWNQQMQKILLDWNALFHR